MNKTDGDLIPSDALVLFGVTGDLAYKKIFPSLYAMAKRGALNVPVVGVASSKWSVTQLRERIADSIRNLGIVHDKEALSHLLDSIVFVSGDYNDRRTFESLKAALGKARRPAHYLAIPPALFTTVIESLGATGLADQGLAPLALPTKGASSSKNRSAAIWRRRANSTASPARCSRATRSSASITSSPRKRS